MRNDSLRSCNTVIQQLPCLGDLRTPPGHPPDTSGQMSGKNSMDEAKHWYCITITAQPEAAEALEFALNSLDALGTEIDSLGKQASDSIEVKGFFDEPPSEESVLAEVDYALRSYGYEPEAASRLELTVVEQSDWLAEWKRHWKPTYVGRFVVAPAWSDIEPAADQIEIRIEPNMAFGTGTHETTQLCLAAIEKNFLSGMKMLDVGTGTGVLAIAAAKLAQPGRIYACDTDTNSITIARENAQLNGVAGSIEFAVGTIDELSELFDLVCANLTLDVILPLLAKLLELTGTTLILSGILAEQEPEIVEALNSHGFTDLHITRKGEWIAITLWKP